MSETFTGFHETSEHEGEVLHYEECYGRLDLWTEASEIEDSDDFVISLHPEEIPGIIKVLKKAYKRYKKEFNNG